MEWTDQGVVLGTRRQGEGHLVLDLLTARHGRHLGLVRGGRSRRLAAALQPGNSLRATWRARLDEQLGHFQVEPVTERAARLIAEPSALFALQALATLARLLPERDPHPEIHAAFEAVLDVLAGIARDSAGMAAPPSAGGNSFLGAPATALLVARMELGLLEALGFGLDLSACALSGARDDLAFVSPKSGRAVAAGPGAPYADRLLRLPPALLGRQDGADPSPADGRDALRLTGHFLDRHVFLSRGLAVPAARVQLLALVERAER
ncbi:DNA repair protein RecO [Prosthecomicrobium pneumaticum]|uniref:DNA repair protein RecO n=1 Tax=Prosthecomicrobium pneumaticum TaxID=81895 RepID=A0A7W9FPZ8_9HYPH|nr:DNA repair protein RecO [Prosthecomicrobium pneumaticum]MBB5754737.1 DNA repair protein RecO (recombination protein O) [Prosthecomicrobium pneumaticum]